MKQESESIDLEESIDKDPLLEDDPSDPDRAEHVLNHILDFRRYYNQKSTLTTQDSSILDTNLELFRIVHSSLIYWIQYEELPDTIPLSIRPIIEHLITTLEQDTAVGPIQSWSTNVRTVLLNRITQIFKVNNFSDSIEANQTILRNTRQQLEGNVQRTRL